VASVLLTVKKVEATGFELRQTSKIERENRMTKITKIIVGAAVMMCVACTSVSAIATLTLQDSLGNVATVSDVDGDGVVTYNAALGSIWTVNVTTGLTKPLLGDSDNPSMDLNSINVSTPQAQPQYSRSGRLLAPVDYWLDITFTDTGFGVGMPATILADIGGTTSGTVLYQTLMDGNLMTSMLFNTTPFSGSDSAAAWMPDDFSLTQYVRITHKSDQTRSTSFNATLNVPDGGMTLSLLGTAMLALGMFVRTRKA